MHIRPLLLLLAAVLLAGCETTSNVPAAGTKPTAGTSRTSQAEVLIPARKLNAIKRGMTVAEVQNLIGKPDNVSPFPAGELKGEVWTYRISVVKRTTMIAASMEDVPFTDPVTGITTMIKEPLLKPQYERFYQTMQFLMVQDRVTERRPSTEEERSFQ